MPRLQHKFQSSRVAAKCEKEGERGREREGQRGRQAERQFVCLCALPRISRAQKATKSHWNALWTAAQQLPPFSLYPPCQPLVSVGVCVWQRTLHLAMHTHLRPLSVNGQCRRERVRERKRDCTRIKCNFHINFPLTALLDAHKL